jgi:hypothetical protein
VGCVGFKEQQSGMENDQMNSKKNVVEKSNCEDPGSTLKLITPKSSSGEELTRTEALSTCEQSERLTSPTREAEFYVLPDGRMIDLIKCARQPGSLEFLIWHDGKTRVAASVECADGQLLVPRLDPTVVSALRLPTTVSTCPSIGELFLRIKASIEKYVDISTEDSLLVTAFILSTWFADRFSIVPYLVVCGSVESGRTTLLRLLYCFCRRAIHVCNITRASVYRLAAQVCPTLLIEGLRRLISAEI